VNRRTRTLTVRPEPATLAKERRSAATTARGWSSRGRGAKRRVIPPLPDNEGPWPKLGLFRLCGEQTDENPHGSTGASNAGAGTSERSDDGPRLVQPRARRKAPSNPPLPDNEGPWRKLGLFRLCGEQTDENPHGSTGASNAGEGTSERSDDDPSTGLALGRVAKR